MLHAAYHSFAAQFNFQKMLTVVNAVDKTESCASVYSHLIGTEVSVGYVSVSKVG